jgi:hypothetical protein
LNRKDAPVKQGQKRVSLGKQRSQGILFIFMMNEATRRVEGFVESKTAIVPEDEEQRTQNRLQTSDFQSPDFGSYPIRQKRSSWRPWRLERSGRFD